MPFADHGRLIAGRLQQLGNRRLRTVEAAVAVVVKAVEVLVLAGEHRRAAGPADGIGHQAAIEPHAFARQAIDVGRLEQLAAARCRR